MYNTKQDLIENIMVKLDVRLKSISDLKANCNIVNNVEELRAFKKELSLFFYEIEDEIRQSIQIIKALLIQNKDFSEQLEEAESKIHNQDKNDDYSLEINNHKLNSIIKENQLLQQNYNKNEQIITDLKERLNMSNNQVLVRTNQLEKHEQLLSELEKNNYSLSQENKLLKEELSNIEAKKFDYNQINSSFLTNNINTIKSVNESKRAQKSVYSPLVSEKVQIGNISSHKVANDTLSNQSNNFYEPPQTISRQPQEHVSAGEIKRGNSEKREPHVSKSSDKSISEKEIFNNMVNEYLQSNLAQPKKAFSEINDDNRSEISQGKPKENYLRQGYSQGDVNIKPNDSKIGKITNLVVKINNSERLFRLCSQRFGKDFLDKLLNPDTSANLIDPLEDYIYEIENYSKQAVSNHYDQNPKNNFNYDKSGLDEEYANDYRDDYDNQVYAPNINTEDTQNYSKVNYQMYRGEGTHPGQEIREEEEEYPRYNSAYQMASPSHGTNKNVLTTNPSKYSHSNYSNIITTNNYIVTANNDFKSQLRKTNLPVANKKIFNNYTKPYGHYFDPKYQYGGASKLEENRIGRKKDSSGNVSNVSKSKSIPKNSANNDLSRVDFDHFKKVAEYKTDEWHSTKDYFVNENTNSYAVRSPDKINNSGVFKQPYKK